MNKLSTFIVFLSFIFSVSAFGATGEIVEKYVAPVRLVWTSDAGGVHVQHADRLIRNYCGQVAVNESNFTVLRSDAGHTASVLLDFGKEMHAGLKLFAGIRPSQRPVNVRITYGESVTEAMSSIDKDGEKKNPTNDHSMREFTLQLPWLGSATTGYSGFRFVRIDLLDKDVDLNLSGVLAIDRKRDYDYVGTFRCNDEELNKIFQVSAYTLHLNMQEYLWDGIKRDRLVWFGDLNPEILTACNVFGSQAFPLIHKSLDFGRDGYALPQWLNGMPSYSMWWVINQYDLYMYEGNTEYLKQQAAYLNGLIDQLIGNIDPKTGAEKIPGGFLDWPTSTNKAVVHAGMQALAIITFDRAMKIATFIGDDALQKKCVAQIKVLRKHRPDCMKVSQALCLNILSEQSKNAHKDALQILDNGVEQYSTFYGYYVSEALAATGHYDEALNNIRKYWKGMLDLGATTFWEDFSYKDLATSGRIDEFVPEGKRDVHADGGDFCYKGLRLSLCHGWSSGPATWMMKEVLGVSPLEPGCKTIRVVPHLGHLQWAEGTFPTPLGTVRIRVSKGVDGKPKADVRAPEGVNVVYE